MPGATVWMSHTSARADKASILSAPISSGCNDRPQHTRPCRLSAAPPTSAKLSASTTPDTSPATHHCNALSIQQLRRPADPTPRPNSTANGPDGPEPSDRSPCLSRLVPASRVRPHLRVRGRLVGGGTARLAVQHRPGGLSCREPDRSGPAGLQVAGDGWRDAHRFTELGRGDRVGGPGRN